MSLLLFFQVIFLVASVIVIVINVGEYQKWQESRKEGNVRPYAMKWFNFVLTSLVALGCLLNIIVGWISK
jgi:hypothetical protein